MFRAITIAREFGSGGGDIGRMLAGRLGWKLLDRNLLEDIARAANIETKVAEVFDECVDPWFFRLTQALWHGGYEGSVATTTAGFFDSAQMASLSRNVIEEAYRIGDCVLVGRGAQCVLKGRPDVFHVFVYGPWKDKVRRVRERVPEAADAGVLIREKDRKRSAYIHRFFDQDWCNPHLYDLMINSQTGDEAATRTILCAMHAE